ncbi:hypothetical protein MRS44_003962 [Fusarium solani]|uniref:uncharacterized protein n=1 Tax=Fusarium solani TaxID=169388 RepID=UPI0032C45FD9|nr:hypothetical protein MRS44_003962 [Fusarium solani]
MDESCHSPQSLRKYAHENLSNRDEDASNDYGSDVSDDLKVSALGEFQDGGDRATQGAPNARVSPGRHGSWKDKFIVHRDVAMHFSDRSNVGFSLDTLGSQRVSFPPTYLDVPPLSGLGVNCPLPSKDSIRLIEILPGTGNMPVAAQIHVTQLSYPQPYEALSYAWGHKEFLHKVTLDNENIPTTTNLFHALERIRLPDRPRLIWVDQLCINQSDDDEKRSQVQLMSRVYKTATRVLVWLGENDTSTPNAAFYLICEVANFFFKSAKASFNSSDSLQPVPVPNVLPEVDSPRWLLLQSLFELNWFWRVWVIQEIALSATACLMWGDSEIEWEWVGLAAAYIRLNNSNVFQHCFMPGIFNTYFMYRISTASERIFKPVSLSFLRLLTMTQQYDTSEPRDRVYGLLGLPCTGRPFIEPNYHLDIQHVYRAAALGIIEAERNLSLLSSVQHGPDFCPSQESWVPRWNTTVFTKSLLSGDSARCHKADGDVPMSRYLSCDRSLRVGGLDSGKVIKVLEVMKNTDFQMVENASVCNRRGLPALQASEDIALLAYTLTAGKDWYGLLVENEGTHVSDFASWVVSRFNIPTSTTSLEPGSETTTSGATSTEDRAQKAAMNAGFSTRTLRLQRPMLATDNEQQDFELFPRSVQHDVDHTETDDQEYFKESIGEQDNMLRQAYSCLADGGDAWRFVEAAQSACNGRRLFLTEDGRLGLGPAAMREGDHLCILFGGSVPFIMRPEGQSWRGQSWSLIGESYVKTLMGGERVKKYKEGLEVSICFEIC